MLIIYLKLLTEVYSNSSKITFN